MESMGTGGHSERYAESQWHPVTNAQENQHIVRVSEKKFSLREALDLLQKRTLSESSDALIDDSSNEEAPANYLLDFR
ncbi:hypothetical protein TNCV_5051591 [Trichonephila clavipes]|nr:hypothetical protein TNCV_5051591 [Trichonephila clavipes]